MLTLLAVNQAAIASITYPEVVDVVAPSASPTVVPLAAAPNGSIAPNGSVAPNGTTSLANGPSRTVVLPLQTSHGGETSPSSGVPAAVALHDRGKWRAVAAALLHGLSALLIIASLQVRLLVSIPRPPEDSSPCLPCSC